jgi:hypothetical protein
MGQETPKCIAEQIGGANLWGFSPGSAEGGIGEDYRTIELIVHVIRDTTVKWRMLQSGQLSEVMQRVQTLSNHEGS